MILGAGLGTRLRPITDHTPKILVPVLGTPMLGRLMAYLARHGVRDIAMNIHHLPAQVEAFTTRLADPFDEAPPLAPPTLFHEPILLGTGGGIANVATFRGEESLLVWNGDILADLPPQRLDEHQTTQGAVGTLAVQDRSGSSKLIVDEDGWLCGIDSPRRGVHRMVRSPVGRTHPMAFQGISLLSDQLLKAMPQEGTFDLIDALLTVVERGLAVNTFDMENDFWGSSGTPEQLEQLEAGLRARPKLLAQWGF